MNHVEWRWAGWLAASGAAALAYEAVWLRRLGLWLGGTSVAAAVTLGAFMAGLALGAWLVDRFAISLDTQRAVRAYGLCELGAAAWALAFPTLLGGARAATLGAPDAAAFAAAFALLIPPSAALGATWPLLARVVGARGGTTLYTANTAGAVCGVLAATFVALPALGVRGTECAAASLGGLVGVAALMSAHRQGPAQSAAPRPVGNDPTLPFSLVAAGAAAAGVAALGLELVWFRLAATALGATVQANGWVLAVFLGTMAVGAAIGRQWPADPRNGLGLGLTGLGVLALAGALLWSQLPYLVAGLWQVGGPEWMLAASAVVAGVAMAGAPAASGLAFSNAVRAVGSRVSERAGQLYAANTLGSIVGAVGGGLWAIPVLELRGALWLFAGIAVVAGAWIWRRPWGLGLAAGLVLVSPAWDARLYAVGVHVRISDFADPSRAAIAAFAAEGWDLVSYDHGATAAVAVGRSRRTGNVWMSINGKVDASTGDDMPTQVLSGALPVRLATTPHDVLVVGLASGITAGAVLADPRVTSLTIAEIEPAVVDASRHFDHVSGAPLDDPRTTLRVRDARALLSRSPRTYDVIVSEPSNPWISGVSSLFTLEYWELVRQRLRPDGIACQWLQLYGMGPDELRGLLRTFLHVFPDAVLIETIEGSDVLLLGGTGGTLPDTVAHPRLGPAQLRALAGAGWLNTDDRPRVEWSAPRWLHYDTGPANAQALRDARKVRAAPALGTEEP